LTFYFGLWNFAAVGVYSIFYQLGVPPFITQGYLVCTSVILAWQLAHFDAWSTWTLLIMLALYDLCAVLTPCGPLRALVHLMSKEDSPEMPGLLYEAELPSEAQRPGVPSSSMPRAQSDVAQPANNNNGNGGSAPTDDSVVAQRSVIPDDVPMATSSMENETNGANSTNNLGDPIVVVPLALARVYNLPIIDVPQPAAAAAGSPPDGRRSTPLLAHDIPDNPTIKQLKSDVTVRLPQNGGRLERIDERRRVYLERDRFGTPKRTVWVDAQGKVFAEAYQEGDEDPESNRKGNTIRLGLGDFIFYSVLVAKAAQYSFTTFCACILVILAGLGGTLVLLSVYHQALPALPISIFLGVVFYLFTRGLIEPWIHEVLRRPYYV
jgi:presenilin 1